jgi:hypothetical protein
MSKSISLPAWRLSVLMAAAGALLGVALVRLGYLPPLPVWPQVLGASQPLPETPLHPGNPDTAYLNYEHPLTALLPQDFNPHQISILIEKSQHRLTIFYDQQPLKAYPVVFGGDPVGDKRREGDLKTPEGIFKIRDRYEHPDWSRFLWLDYPTPQAWREHYAAKVKGQLNWFFPIGGQVGIHGVPAGQDILIDQRANWTWGCPSLKNADVIEIDDIVQVGTWVEIVP